MSLNQKVLTKSLILVAFTAALLYGYSTQPPAEHTGCFGETTCIECHSDFDVDSGGGSLTIDADPLDDGTNLFVDGYQPGQTYTIYVTIAQDGQSRWGFQMATRFDSTSQQAGHFTEGADGFTSVQTDDFNSVEYIGHTSLGTQMGTPDGPVTFTFQWTAPATDEIPADGGQIDFCAAGNAANGSFDPTGDYIYTASQVAVPYTPPDGGD